MSTNLQTLKGFRDFLPQEARKRQWFVGIMQKIYNRFGFEPLETPALEYESLLAGKYGDEADKLIYRFEDNGGRKVALRYDQTVPTTRVIAQYQNDLTFPFKRYQIQPVWRADKPQKGRYREFFQSDADIVGSTSAVADAEILALYVAIYKEMGLTSLKIKINDRQKLITSITSTGISEDMIFSVIQTIDKLDKKSEKEVLEELEQKGISADSAKQLLENLQSSQIPDNLEKIISLAHDLGVSPNIFSYSSTLARGLDYYTGMIFEGIIPEYTVGSVGGGGRYDKLIDTLVGVDLPAVGFAIGFDRTIEAAELLGKIPSDNFAAQVLVCIFSPDMASMSLKITDTLRSSGIAAECYLDANKKLDHQLKYANKKNIPFVIVLGPDEAQKNTVVLKNMQTKEQKEMALDEVINFVRKF